LSDSGDSAPRRVLVVEDDPAIAALVAYQLTREGFRVETALNGSQALDAVGRNPPDFIVLDRMLPVISGDDVLKQLRKESATAQIPVLVLTAKREQEDRISGLELGADDYLAKPFSPRELVLRVHSILRRVEGAGHRPSGRVIKAGPLTLDLSSFSAQLNGEDIGLTPTEFRLLRALVESAGKTQSRVTLLEKAWGYRSNVSSTIETRRVDMHVRRLRSKLGSAGGLVQTRRGFGYRFVAPNGPTSRHR